MNLRANYSYRSSEFTVQTYSYVAESPIEFETNHENNSTPSPKTYHYSYSSYYDWLNQEEELLASCRLSETNGIFLTNKNVTVKKGNTKRHFPLRQLQNIELKFTRLAFPLVTGGITAPLSALATANDLVDLIPGILIVVVSTLLFYYGWVGSYQLHLDFKTHKITYFSDEEGDKLKLLVNKGNQLIQQRYQMY